MLDLVESRATFEYIYYGRQEVHERTLEVRILRHDFKDWNCLSSFALLDDFPFVVLIVGLFFIKLTKEFTQEDVNVETDHLLGDRARFETSFVDEALQQGMEREKIDMLLESFG